MRGHWAAAGLCLAVLLAGGCSDRHLTIVQDDFVNNGMQHGRAEKDRTGEPLQIDIVCVHPEDLRPNEHIVKGLGPDSGITADVWFEHRPQTSYKNKEKDSSDKIFRLPKNHIFVLCRKNDEGKPETYGEYRRPCLRGAKLDGRSLTVDGIQFRSSSLFDDNSIIYVFGKFTDDKGKVLKTAPAVFHPPGKYTANIRVKVGVHNDQMNDPDARGQYIENTTVEGR
jgi:hypothetical protein